jgi:hypothetical protein
MCRELPLKLWTWAAEPGEILLRSASGIAHKPGLVAIFLISRLYKFHDDQRVLSRDRADMIISQSEKKYHAFSVNVIWWVVMHMVAAVPKAMNAEMASMML